MPDVKIIGGTSGFPDVLAIASTDQVTIFGSGSIQDPLRALPSSGSLRALYADPNVPVPVIGSPVTVTDDDPGVEVTAVVLSSGNLLSGGAGIQFSIGLITAILDGGAVTVQTFGEVTLTTAQWDLITLDVGGLVTGSVYYVSFGFNDFGHLTVIESNSSGTAIAPVGTALSSTVLLLGTLPVPARFA